MAGLCSKRSSTIFLASAIGKVCRVEFIQSIPYVFLDRIRSGSLAQRSPFWKITPKSGSFPFRAVPAPARRRLIFIRPKMFRMGGQARARGPFRRGGDFGASSGKPHRKGSKVGNPRGKAFLNDIVLNGGWKHPG